MKPSAEGSLFSFVRGRLSFWLEAGWGLGGHVECVFEREAGAGYCAFVEEAAYERNAVGDSVGCA